LIGRAALGAPWLPGDIARGLASAVETGPRSFADLLAIVSRHVERMHEFYGEDRAVGIVRKHVKGYLAQLGVAQDSWHEFNRIETASAQRTFLVQLDPQPRGALAA